MLVEMIHFLFGHVKLFVEFHVTSKTVNSSLLEVEIISCKITLLELCLQLVED